MVKNKRGFIKILEVMFSITILAVSILYLYSSVEADDSGFDHYIETYQQEVLNKISNDEDLRRLVLEENEAELIDSVFLPENLNYTIRICELEDKPQPCNMEPKLFLALRDKDVYVSETIIAADLNEYNPMKVRLFIWLLDFDEER